MNAPVHDWCHTDASANLECRTFEWVVERFTHGVYTPGMPGQSFYSSVFTTGHQNEVAWRLGLCPLFGPESDVSDCITHVLVQCRSRSRSDTRIQFRLRMSTSCRERIFFDSVSLYGNVGTPREWRTIEDLEVKRYAELQRCLRMDGTVIVTLDLRVVLEELQPVVSSRAYSVEVKQAVQAAAEALHRPIKLPRDQPPDVTLVMDADEGEELPAHILILAMASGYFKTRFGPMIRNTSSAVDADEVTRIRVPDVRADTMRGLLHYMYNQFECFYADHRPSRRQDTTAEMLEAAEFLQAPYQKLLLQEEIILRVDSENVADLLMLADRAKASYLREYAQNYIVANWKEVSSSNRWAELKAGVQDNPQFAALVMELAQQLATTLRSADLMRFYGDFGLFGVPVQESPDAAGRPGYPRTCLTFGSAKRTSGVFGSSEIQSVDTRSLPCKGTGDSVTYGSAKKRFLGKDSCSTNSSRTNFLGKFLLGGRPRT